MVVNKKGTNIVNFLVCYWKSNKYECMYDYVCFCYVKWVNLHKKHKNTSKQSTIVRIVNIYVNTYFLYYYKYTFHYKIHVHCVIII